MNDTPTKTCACCGREFRTEDAFADDYCRPGCWAAHHGADADDHDGDDE